MGGDGILEPMVQDIAPTNYNGIAILIGACVAAGGFLWKVWTDNRDRTERLAAEAEAKADRLKAKEAIDALADVARAIKSDTDGNLQAARDEIKEAKTEIKTAREMLAQQTAAGTAEIQRQVAELRSENLASAAATLAAKATKDALAAEVERDKRRRRDDDDDYRPQRQRPRRSRPRGRGR